MSDNDSVLLLRLFEAKYRARRNRLNTQRFPNQHVPIGAWSQVSIMSTTRTREKTAGAERSCSGSGEID
jgi:hypothetical protein